MSFKVELFKVKMGIKSLIINFFRKEESYFWNRLLSVNSFCSVSVVATVLSVVCRLLCKAFSRAMPAWFWLFCKSAAGVLVTKN